MDTELRDLYQAVIVDHGRNPRHFAALPDYTHRLEGYNPLCGDRLELYLKVEDGRIRDVGFTGKGCAISMASASLMSEAVLGRTVQEALALQRRFQDLLLDRPPAAEGPALGKLEVLSGVKAFPSRVKCATLAWHTLAHALEHPDGEPVCTE